MGTAHNLLLRFAPALFVVLWSTGFVVARLTAGHVEPVTFLAIRFPIAGLLLTAMALLLRLPWPGPAQVPHAVTAGVLLHALYLAPIYWAVAHGMPGGVSALIVGLQPLITAFLAGVILQERIALRHWLALATGLAGVAMVLAPKFSAALQGGIGPLTAGLCLAGTVSVSLGTVYQKRFAGAMPLVTSVVWQYVGASLVTGVLALLLEDFGFDTSPEAWIGLVWSVLVLSVAAIFLLMMLIRDGAVSRVSSLIFLVPGVSALMTFWLFGEKLNLVQLAGMLICALAVFIVSRAPRAPA